MSIDIYSEFNLTDLHVYTQQQQQLDYMNGEYTYKIEEFFHGVSLFEVVLGDWVWLLVIKEFPLLQSFGLSPLHIHWKALSLYAYLVL